MAAPTPPRAIPPSGQQCPECGSKKVVLTLKTSPGHYCLCEYCAHIWHCEGPGQHTAPT